MREHEPGCNDETDSIDSSADDANKRSGFSARRVEGSEVLH